MKTGEWVELTLRQTWRFLRESFSREKELAPIEEDPVGEFLEKKKSGKLPDREGEDEAPRGDGEAIQAPADSGVSEAQSEKVEAIAALGVSKGQEAGEPGMTEEKTGDTPVASPVEAKSEAAEAAEAVPQLSEEPVKTEDRPQVLETASRGIASTNLSPTEKPEKAKGDDTESLLEVFKSEQEEMETLGPIAEELSDMSVYSLLEEGKKIAARFKGGRGESS